MTVDELKKIVEQKTGGVVLFDVREGDEIKGDIIDGAISLPMGRVFVEASRGNIPKDKKIIAICKSGVRSEIVARELKARGYDIDYLVGGMDEWKSSVKA